MPSMSQLPPGFTYPVRPSFGQPSRLGRGGYRGYEFGHLAIPYMLDKMKKENGGSSDSSK